MGLLDNLLLSDLLMPQVGNLPAKRKADFMPNLGMLGLLPNPEVGTGLEPQFGSGNSFPMPGAEPGAQGGDGGDAAAARAAAAAGQRRSVIKPWSPNALAPASGVWPPAPDVAGSPPGDDPNLGVPNMPSMGAPIDVATPPQPPAEDIPLPRPRPDGLGVPLSIAPEAELPPGAAPTAGRAAAPEASPASPSFLSGAKGILDKVFDPNKAATWLALGSGFSGAPSLGTGMRRAFGAAVPAMAADRAQGKLQEGVAATYRALVSKGVPPNEALAAATNPVLMKAVADKYFDDQLKPTKIGVDALGNDVMGSFHARTGKYFDAAGREVKAPDQGGGSSTTALGGQSLFAKGVSEYNADLPGDEYLAQFSPDVRAGIESYVRGDTMPTANPRLKGLNQKIKDWAQVYGNKTGTPVSDATFSERRKYRTELGANSANTAGGQAKAFNQGIEHMHGLATKMIGLDNSSGMGIPAVAEGMNKLRQAFSTTKSGKAAEVNALGQTLAGEVGKLFSGSAGGGVHEREATRDRFKSINSPEQLAGALEGTLETMEGGLRALEQRRDSVLGPNSNVELMGKETQAKMDQIRGMIRQLKGEQPAGAPAAPAAPSLKPGEATTINGVTIRRLN